MRSWINPQQHKKLKATIKELAEWLNWQSACIANVWPYIAKKEKKL
jgi:hypothetical protein